jgi:hypothetical protein
MTGRNPYAPSTATMKSRAPAGGATTDVWSDGKWLVMEVDARLPARCVRCNAPAEALMKQQTLYWHHPAIYLLLLFWVVIYVVVALIVRKSLKVDVGLCEEHRRARRNALIVGFIGLIGSIPAAMALGKLGYPGAGALSGILGFLGSLIYVLVKARILRVKKIDEDEARLGGCGEAFLASLPRYR